jgi:lysophospholipase L1-like esterase
MSYVLYAKQRIVIFLALFTVTILMLGLAAECDRGSGGDGYDPNSGDHMWRRAAVATVAAGTAPLRGTPGPIARHHSPPHNAVIAVSGDSIVAEGNLPVVDRLVTKLGALEQAGGNTVVDRTRGGQRLIDGTDPINLVDDWPGLLISQPAPKIVVTEVGMDDLYGSPDDAWEAAYAQLDSQAMAAGVLLVPCLITPLNDAVGGHDLREPQRGRLNAWLLSYFGAARVVNTQTALAGANGQLDPAYDLGDGMHLNAAGVVVLAGAISARLG